MMGSLKKIINKFFLEKLEFVRFSVNRNDRAGILNKSWGLVFNNQLEGAYYEFGIYKGESFIESWKEYLKFKRWSQAQLASPEAWRRDIMKRYVAYEHAFYGFDTFEGLPSNNEGSRAFQKGGYLSSFEEVEAKCRSIGVRHTLFKGRFCDIPDETIGKLQPAAIINIDSDLYLSARDALEKVKDKFQQGTILLMDDYNCFLASDSQGERRALREFCERYPRFRFEPWTMYLYAGQAFICHLQK